MYSSVFLYCILERIFFSLANYFVLCYDVEDKSSCPCSKEIRKKTAEELLHKWGVME